MFVNKVNLGIGNTSYSFYLDTGFNGAVMLKPYAYQQLFLKDQLRSTRQVKTTSLFRELTKEAGTLQCLDWGPFHHENLSVIKGSENSLGLKYLQRYVVTLDLTGKTLYLRPSKNHAAADREDMSGIHLVRKDDKILVDGIDEGSPAKSVGITSGDEIVQLNETAFQSFRLSEIRRILRSGAGDTVKLALKNEGVERLVSFRLQSDFTQAIDDKQ